ncbi:hypothetical protein ACA910_004031, partial [Epithemia clementina (nom. ined.)]
METGRAWRTILDPTVYAMAFLETDATGDDFLGPTNTKVSNNLFEFIAAVVTIWQACKDGAVAEEA